MTRSEFALLRAASRDSISYDVATNVLGYQPGIAELNSYLERHGLIYCGNWVWKKAGSLVRQSGRPASAAERLETARTAPRMSGTIKRRRRDD